MWRGYTTGNATPTSNITASGSATFAGDGHFKCGGTDPEHGVKFFNDGEVKIWRPTGGGASVNLISGASGVGTGTEQFAIKADGSGHGLLGYVSSPSGIGWDDGTSYAYLQKGAADQPLVMVKYDPAVKTNPGILFFNKDDNTDQTVRY